jgi:hypothetical protein
LNAGVEERSMFLFSTTTSISFMTASVIARDVVKELEVDPPILQNLRSVIDFARQMRQEDEPA